MKKPLVYATILSLLLFCTACGANSATGSRAQNGESTENSGDIDHSPLQ